MIVAGGELLVELVQRLARPEQSSRTGGLALEAPTATTSLLKMMVQDQSEASSSRIITAFTTMSARMNMETMEKLPRRVAGRAGWRSRRRAAASAWVCGGRAGRRGDRARCAQAGQSAHGAAPERRPESAEGGDKRG